MTEITALVTTNAEDDALPETCYDCGAVVVLDLETDYVLLEDGSLQALCRLCAVNRRAGGREARGS